MKMIKQYIRTLFIFGIVSTILFPAFYLLPIFAIESGEIESYPSTLTMSDTTYTDNLGIVYELHEGEATIVAYVGETRIDIVIPDTIIVNDETYKITNIGQSAFRSKYLTNVIIPDSVTTIEFNAFFENRLTTIEIPNSVTTIGAAAFMSNQLTNIVIPDSLTRIEQQTFDDNQLTSIEIPKSITYIGRYAFWRNQITSVFISDSVTQIEGRFFDSNPLEIIYTDIGNANNLLKILSTMGTGSFYPMERITTESTILAEERSRYHESTSTNNIVSIDDNLEFEAIPQRRFVHNNIEMEWDTYVSEIQWFKDGEILAGQTNAILLLESIQEGDTGIYYAKVDGIDLEDIIVSFIEDDDLEEEIEKEEDNEKDIESDDKGTDKIDDDNNSTDEKTEENENVTIDTSDTTNISLYVVISLVMLTSIAYLKITQKEN